MAIEARHVNFFPPQLIVNRDCLNPQANMNRTQMDFATLSAIPYGQSLAVDPTTIATTKACFNKSDSGVTYNVSRKRSRDSAFCDSNALAAAQKRRHTVFGSLFDQEMASQIQQQQSQIDQFVAQQTEKLRMDLEERHRTQTRMLASALQTAIAKKLKAKDEEIVKIGKLNWVLQERVKSLFVENQIWRDLAQTNEATANNLRNNLEHVLAQVDIAAVEDHRTAAAAPAEDDAESSCGSCSAVGDRDDGGDFRRRRPAVSGICRRCGEREASVLVLPCRHLCLCSACGSALLRACPVCDTAMNASVHVNMS